VREAGRANRRLGGAARTLSAAALYAYVFELVHQGATSLDIVQESFIAAARHITACGMMGSLARGCSTSRTRSAFSIGGWQRRGGAD